MIKLSIIVPVYNVEKYIERCIRSISKQDLPSQAYEIIIVNDGSTDDSLNIINNVSKEYTNIIVHTQENTGLGGARNKGITLAKGTYIWFIDSDDFIAENCLNELVNFIETKSLDVLSFDFNCTDEEGNIINWIDFKLDYQNKPVVSGDTFYFNNYVHSYIWLYIFKTSLFTTNQLRFEERINMQDSEIMPRIMHHVNKIAPIHKVVYYYVNRENSFINSKKKNVRKRYYDSIIKVNSLLNSFKNSLPKEALITQGINNKLADINRILFLQFIFNDFDRATLKDILKSLKSHKLYPFPPIEEENKLKKINYNLLRLVINKFPIATRNLYLKLK
ncbi:glycosyltransferase [Mariniflexile litorale]|uniref:Glycosyltransferase n=1 Tax=Mariniflexile litorale TaxID=3045158 RepID=A0AAU7EF48_9FLAO|nr:glycosyltransferase [Mariniflexile sp. KMM 9835]MDQ8211507.1 glycosyltransferase [Mariniflexile sp. KMM 9835]